MKLSIYILFLFCIIIKATAQIDTSGFKVPPNEILKLMDSSLYPALFLIDSQKEKVIIPFKSHYKSLVDINNEEVGLAGIIVNKDNTANKNMTFYSTFKYKLNLKGELKDVIDLPENARLSYFTWSPDQSKIAFTNTTLKGIELWYFDFHKEKIFKITEPILNGSIGQPFSWFKDSKFLIVKTISSDKSDFIKRNDLKNIRPIIFENINNTSSQSKTFKNLLTDNIDELNFDKLTTSELSIISLSGKSRIWKGKDIYIDFKLSPDNNYVLIKTLKKPFSYSLPYDRFATQTNVYDINAQLVKEIFSRDLVKILPKGKMAVETGKRNINWRHDKSSTIYWVEALDGGDPQTDIEFRDEIFEWEWPFKGIPKSLTKIKYRFKEIIWGNNDICICNSRWDNTKKEQTILFNPSDNLTPPIIISDIDYQDVYNNPGRFERVLNRYGLSVLNIVNNKAFLIGQGYAFNGKFPFIDEIDLKSQAKNRLYQSNYTDKDLSIHSIINLGTNDFLASAQSQKDYPNYYILNTKSEDNLTPITYFEGPLKELNKIQKKHITIKRKDGIKLTGILYLPEDYDTISKIKLPLLIWAYPMNYKNKTITNQNHSGLNSYTFINHNSPIFWVSRGYAVFDNAYFPIVEDKGKYPNDTFIDQLISNAEATISTLDSLGYIDRRRIAIGGHSYGAFMVANLLTHSNLFAAGIARSGAYNRTLTPFGFQYEERNYWDAPDVYNLISPFMHAEKMKTPLLLIHGNDDSNRGTDPLQSKLYYEALKSLGAPVRLVLLPYENHNYEIKENILHTLWEQDQWLEKNLKKQ